MVLFQDSCAQLFQPTATALLQLLVQIRRAVAGESQFDEIIVDSEKE